MIRQRMFKKQDASANENNSGLQADEVEADRPSSPAADDRGFPSCRLSDRALYQDAITARTKSSAKKRRWKSKVSRQHHVQCSDATPSSSAYHFGGVRGSVALVVRAPTQEKPKPATSRRWFRRLVEELERIERIEIEDASIQKLVEREKGKRRDSMEDEAKHWLSGSTLLDNENSRGLSRLMLNEDDIILLQPQLNRSVTVPLARMLPRPRFARPQRPRTSRNQHPSSLCVDDEAKQELPSRIKSKKQHWKESKEMRPLRVSEYCIDAGLFARV